MKRVLREERNKIVVFIISTFILGLVEVSFATIIQKFIDSLESSDITKFKLAIFSFTVFLVVNYILNLFVIWIQSVLTKNIHLYLKSNLAKYFLSLGYCDFSETTTGEKMNCFDYKISLIEQYFLDSIFSMIQSTLMLIIASVYLYQISPLICIIVFALGIVSMLVPLLLGKKLNDLVSENVVLSGEYLHFIKEMFQGILAVKNFQKERTFFEKFEEKLFKFEQNAQLLNVKNGEYNQISGFFQYVIIISCLCFGGFLVLNQGLTLGKMIAVTQISNLIVGPIQQIGSSVIDILASKDITKEMSDIFLKQSIVLDKKVYQKGFDNIRISTCSVTKDNKKLLGGVNLSLEYGKKYCIIGPNGSGKTTFGRLMLNLLNDVEERVFIDREASNLEDVAKLISYVPQNSIAFKGTLKDNITLFERYDDKIIDEVIRDVNLNNKSKEIQMISENGDNISGGELRKVNIARAFLEDRPIILVDEFESALDEESSKLIADKFLSSEKTLIMISHNLEQSFLQRFDSIIFMENGEVTAMGKYEVLLKNCDNFYKYLIQTAPSGGNIHEYNTTSV